MTIEDIILTRLSEELVDPVYANMTLNEAWERLHATAVKETATRPKTLTLQGSLSGLSPGSKARLRDWNDAQKLKDAILSQDRLAVGIYLDLLVAGDELTPALVSAEEAAAVMAELAATETVEVTIESPPRIWTVVRAIPGGPNDVTKEQFAAAWMAIGRN